MKNRIALAALLGAAAIHPVHADNIQRRPMADFPIASSVTVSAGSKLVFLSGTVADVADAKAAPGTIDRLGDTATQADERARQTRTGTRGLRAEHGRRRQDERLSGR